jgi:hypothetical protein
MIRSSKGSLPFRFSDHNSVFISYLSCPWSISSSLI